MNPISEPVCGRSEETGNLNDISFKSVNLGITFKNHEQVCWKVVSIAVLQFKVQLKDWSKAENLVFMRE